MNLAAELKLSHAEVLSRAKELNGGNKVEDVFVPNCGLDVFKTAEIIGITNGLAPINKAANLPDLKASVLKAQKKKNGKKPLFRNPEVESQLTKKDHSFSLDRMDVKQDLKRLLHLELFGSEPPENLVILGSVGRLVPQKNFNLVASVAERIIESFPAAKFAILASPPEGDKQAQELQIKFEKLQANYPESFFYSDTFSQPISRLILAGSDFALMPSRFEPCGLVDYEACALGTVVIGHNTGGLSKVAECAYLYEWLDSGDTKGEQDAFTRSIEQAVNTLFLDPEKHLELVKAAMNLDSGWEKSAAQYIDMYLYGRLFKAWQGKKTSIVEQVDRYALRLFEKHPFFPDFYSTALDDILEQRMSQTAKLENKSGESEK